MDQHLPGRGRPEQVHRESDHDGGLGKVMLAIADTRADTVRWWRQFPDQVVEIHALVPDPAAALP
jgi:hypothetical protein